MQRENRKKEQEEKKKASEHKLVVKNSTRELRNGQKRNVHSASGKSSSKNIISQQKQTPRSLSSKNKILFVPNPVFPNLQSSTIKTVNRRGWESLPIKPQVPGTPVTVPSNSGSTYGAKEKEPKPIKPSISSRSPTKSSSSSSCSSQTASSKQVPTFVSLLNANETKFNATASRDVEKLKPNSATSSTSNDKHQAISIDSSKNSTETIPKNDEQSIPNLQKIVSSPIHTAAVSTEPPAVSIFRRDKLSQLLNKFSSGNISNPLQSVKKVVLRKVIFRWIMRAAHESSSYIDFIIPSWIDIEKLVTFFQRQLISETLKSMPSANNSLKMESLKEAGRAVAYLCHSYAKDVADFRRRVVDQLPRNWNDSSIGINIAGPPNDLDYSSISINWANQGQVSLTRAVFMKLKQRFKGATSQLLSSIFVCKICYDTKLLLTEGTSMDFSLTHYTRSKLISALSISLEAWSNPFLAVNTSFWGQFAEIDRMFGGLDPFGTSDANEYELCKNGGSFSVITPPDSMLASKYMNKIVDILDTCEQRNLPASFAVFIRSDCLLNQNCPPNTDDLYVIEPRLKDRIEYVSRVDILSEINHFYFSEKLGRPEASTTASIFALLQNNLGKERFPLRNFSIVETMGSTERESKAMDRFSRVSSSLYPSEFSQKTNVMPYPSQPLQLFPPSSILPSVARNSVGTDLNFSSIGISGSTIPSSFGGQDFPSSTTSTRRTGTRRGRLFDLVDSGEEDTMNEIDVVSGMLGSLNVDLFQNNGAQDVDIEAISLMGIDESPLPNSFQTRSNKSRGHFG